MKIHIETKIIEVDKSSVYIAIDCIDNNLDFNKPVVIIPPAFDKTMRDYFMFSMYFIANDFITVRYDNVNHLGLSTGDIYNYDLSESLKALNGVCDFVKQKFATSTIYILGTSLIGRVVIKHLTLSYSQIYSHVGLLMPVVDVGDTIRRVTSVDYFGKIRNGEPVKEVTLLGNTVSTDFIKNAIADNFSTLQSTIDDLKKADKQLSVFVAKQDEWVNIEDEKTVFSEYQQCEQFITLNYSSHQLERNLKAAKTMLEEVVTFFAKKHYGKDYNVCIPGFHDIVNNSKIDRMKKFE